MSTYYNNNSFLQIREECKVLQLTDKQIKEIMSRLHKDLVKGLGKDTHDKAVVKCFITYIQDLPNGRGTKLHTQYLFKLHQINVNSHKTTYLSI